MSDSLLDAVVHEEMHDRVDDQYVLKWFSEVGEEYVEEADDPTTEMVETLVRRFEDRDPADVDDETLAVLWTTGSIMRWMLDDLPLQGEMTDPEWLRRQLRIWEMAGGSG